MSSFITLPSAIVFTAWLTRSFSFGPPSPTSAIVSLSTPLSCVTE